jgi:ketosteroid isomerase-like protein
MIMEMFRAVDTREWNDLQKFFDVRSVYERPGYETFVGIERLLKFYRDERAASEGTHFIEHIVVEGDCAACWGRFEGVLKDGSIINERFADVYTFADGKVRTRRTHFYRPAL